MAILAFIACTEARRSGNHGDFASALPRYSCGFARHLHICQNGKIEWLTAYLRDIENSLHKSAAWPCGWFITYLFCCTYGPI